MAQCPSAAQAITPALLLEINHSLVVKRTRQDMIVDLIQALCLGTCT